MKTYIIAEAGVNHNGDFNLAKDLIYKAKEVGADAVKFQTFTAEKIVSRTAPKADYQTKTTSTDESQFQMLKKLELSYEQFRALKEYSNQIGIEFLSTPFDEDSIEFLTDLQISKWKIPSGEITNLPYLVKIEKTKLPIILSTGMSTMKEIAQALEVFRSYDRSDITLLHCNTEYPTPFSDVNLKAMLTMRDTYGVKVGYSDHTSGIEVPIAAVALGAEVIEKHFTLDKSMPGPDHKASLDPDEFVAMVKAIRNIEQALGTGIKQPSSTESKNIAVIRKSIVAKRAIQKGEMFTEDNITTKRPGDGMSPMKWFDLLGKVASRDYPKDTKIKEKLMESEDVEQ